MFHRAGSVLQSLVMFGDESILFEKTQVMFTSTLRESTGTAYDLERIGEAFIQGRQDGWFGFGVDAIK